MSEEPRQVDAEITILDQVVDRLAETDDERMLLRRQLGVDALEANMVANLAPTPAPIRPPDPLMVAEESAARYQQWVEGYPDSDTTPLRDRERALADARASVKRLRQEV